MEAAEEAKENITRLTDKIKDLEERINDHQNRENILFETKKNSANFMS